MDIELISEDRRSFDIYLDGDLFTKIHKKIFGSKPKLPKGADFIEEFDLLELSRAKYFVYKKLSSRSYNSYQIKKLLKEHHVRDKTASKIIEECTGLGYINDTEWAQSFVRSLQNRFGPQQIRMKLRAKLVPDDLIDQLEMPQNQTEKIKYLIDTRYKKRDISDPKEKQKLIQSLLRKGFDYQSIKACLK